MTAARAGSSSARAASGARRSSCTGHQDLSTTQRYMHLSPAHKDAAIRLLDRRPADAQDEAARGGGVEAAPAVAEKGKEIK